MLGDSAKLRPRTTYRAVSSSTTSYSTLSYIRFDSGWFQVWRRYIQTNSSVTLSPPTPPVLCSSQHQHYPHPHLSQLSFPGPTPCLSSASSMEPLGRKRSGRPPSSKPACGAHAACQRSRYPVLLQGPASRTPIPHHPAHHRPRRRGRREGLPETN